jgi:hypothetical protein
VAAFYDATLDQWSLPRQLTHDGDAESALSLVAEGAGLVLAYTKTQTVRTNLSLEINGQVQLVENVPQPGRTDIGLLTHALGHDLAVAPTSLRIDPPNPAPGSLATNIVLVENRGELAVQNLQVVFYDGHPQQGGVPFGAPQTLTGSLVGGAAREVSVAWAVPADLRSHDLYAVVDPALAFDDRDRANNVAGVRTVLPDLVVQTGWNTEVSAGEVMLVAKVANVGALPTLPFEVSWRLAAPDGQEIARTPVGSLAAGGTVDVSQGWNTSGWQVGNAFASIYAVADATGVVQEWNESNNAFPQTVRVRPAWVPRMVSIELRPPVGLRLVVEAVGAAASDLVIESTGSLASPIWWDREFAPATPLAEPGVFEVDMDRTDEARFYRVRLGP